MYQVVDLHSNAIRPRWFDLDTTMAILFSAGTVLNQSNPRVLLNEKLLLCLDAFAPTVDLRIGLDDRGR
jgi:hypothetical protein